MSTHLSQSSLCVAEKERKTNEAKSWSIKQRKNITVTRKWKEPEDERRAIECRECPQNDTKRETSFGRLEVQRNRKAERGPAG
mmetsp:Transcript_14065/g.28162  ORF Transcript_14065/g.28162 Transcript_14065/m.28162 type:complete len:83 (-) Transcript_14065:8-256(-)